MLTPWIGWSYTSIPTKNGGKQIQSNNPEWWIKYNKVKHARTTICPETKKPYYQYANQKNVLDSLAALFIVDSYILNMICNRLENPGDSNYFLKTWYESSNLFSGFMAAGIP